MSIYDGKCDRGSKAGEPCGQPATHYSCGTTYAWCDADSLGNTPIKGTTWPEVVAEYETIRRDVDGTIERAEREGLFLRDGESVCSPRQMRQYINNGWTITSLTTVDPAEAASRCERKAEQHEARAKSLRAEAAAIRREMAQCAPFRAA